MRCPSQHHKRRREGLSLSPLMIKMSSNPTGRTACEELLKQPEAQPEAVADQQNADAERDPSTPTQNRERQQSEGFTWA